MMERAGFIVLGPIGAHVKCEDALLPYLQAFGCVNTPKMPRAMLQLHLSLSDTPWGSQHRTIRRGSYFEIQTPFYRGSFDVELGVANLVLAPPDVHLETHERRLYGALRMIISIYLLENGGAALHGCALGDANRAHIFLGKSGTGKTTLAKMSQDKVLLGDDLVAILPDENGAFQVYGTPFSGREGMVPTMSQLPLATLSQLSQSQHTTVEKLPTPDAMKAVLSHLFVFEGSERTRELALKVAQRLVALAQPLHTKVKLGTPPWEAEDLR